MTADEVALYKHLLASEKSRLQVLWERLSTDAGVTEMGAEGEAGEEAETEAVEPKIEKTDGNPHRRAVYQKLQDIGTAQARIVDGTYGHCIHCNKLIERDRLVNLPHALSCLTCQLRSESGEDPLSQ